jgi:acetylornithine aminotransferase
MIGFDVPENLKDLKKNLLNKHHIFTGESKPNVIRLLPALNINKNEIDEFLKALKEETKILSSQETEVNSSTVAQ